MIPIELLRHFDFFYFLDDKEIKAIAMISQELQLGPGEVLFEIGEPADALYFLIEGDLPYCLVDPGEQLPGCQQEYVAGYIHPRELFGISALIEPYTYTTTLQTQENCRVIEINAHALRALCEVDLPLAVHLMKTIARTAMNRLEMTRAQLAEQASGAVRKMAS